MEVCTINSELVVRLITYRLWLHLLSLIFGDTLSPDTVMLICQAVLLSSSSQYRFTNVNTVFTSITQWSRLECSMSPTCPIAVEFIFSLPILAVMDEALTATFGMKVPPDWSQATLLLVYECTDHLSYDCRRAHPAILLFGPICYILALFYFTNRLGTGVQCSHTVAM